MEPFNIKISYGDAEVTLTILPTEEDYFKVIYFGGILGAVCQEKSLNSWKKVPDEEVIAGDLPLYRHDLTADRPDVVLDENTVQSIGEEILNGHHG